MCRSFGHQWRPTIVEVIRDTRGEIDHYVQHVKCVSCETEKAVGIDRTGNINARRYRYADGYQVKGGLTSDDRAEMRRRAVDG